MICDTRRHHHSSNTMLAPILRRVVLQPSSQSFILPPVFLLPWRAHLSTITNTTSPTPPQTAFRSQKASPTASTAATIPSPPPPPFSAVQQQSGLSPSSEPQHAVSTPALQSPPALLTSLAAQPPHYIIAHLHARPYLLTAGDKLRLPFYLANAPIGTILRFNRASALGSRDYTFRGSPWVDEQFFVCRMRVIGVEGEPMRVVKKTKRRQRHVKTVKSKMRFTILRCIELRVLGDRKGEDEEHSEQDPEEVL